jgi:hypothetical protein
MEKQLNLLFCPIIGILLGIYRFLWIDLVLTKNLLGGWWFSYHLFIGIIVYLECISLFCVRVRVHELFHLVVPSFSVWSWNSGKPNVFLSFVSYLMPIFSFPGSSLA